MWGWTCKCVAYSRLQAPYDWSLSRPLSDSYRLQRTTIRAASSCHSREVNSWIVERRVERTFCTLWAWFWSYHVSISRRCQSLISRISQQWSRSLLGHFPCAALHWTCYHDCVESFKQLANQVGYMILQLSHRLPGIYGNKQTLSSGSTLGLGSFTAINPCPRVITIT